MTSSLLVSRLVKHIERIAPLQLADRSWDNVGLLVDPPCSDASRSKVMLTIDLTDKAADEIIAAGGVGAVVAYHPAIFRGLKRISQRDGKELALLKCIANGIAVYSPHTALDSCNDGINDWLARGVGKGFVRPITPSKDGPEGTGMGRLLTLDSPLPFKDVVARVKGYLGLSYLRVARPSLNNDKLEIRTVAICAGSGASLLLPVKADLYLTGEMGHHELLSAISQGTSVILCEHSNSERGYLESVLKPRLQALFDADEHDVPVQILSSKEDRDPVEII